VTVGTSKLITSLDYSDTFTVGLPERPSGNFPTGTGLNVEKSYGHPVQTWVWDALGTLNTDANAHELSPGGSEAGSDTGMSQFGGGERFGEQLQVIQYGLRDRYVVQVDAVQTSDRVIIWSSASADPFDTKSNSVGVFFRPSGNAIEIGLFRPSVGEVGTDFLSTLTENTWNNYAVEFSAHAVKIYVNQVLVGSLDLTEFDFGTFNNVSNAYVGYDALGSDVDWVKWSDNFQVGGGSHSVKP